MQRLKLFQIDAFTREVFGGNPAAVVPLSEWPANSLLQAIAAENNCSETAFFVQDGDRYDLRWFTPTREVPLCGHATLAAALVIFTVLDPSRSSVAFDTKSGALSVQRMGDVLTLTVPNVPLKRCKPPGFPSEGLDTEPSEVLKAEADPNYYAVFEQEEAVRAAGPELSLLKRLHPYGVAITAPGEEVDFVSRYFAPSYGIPEDPATGSIHAALAPYWADRLGTHRLQARQLSPRGGDLFCEPGPKNVKISGHTVIAFEGYFYL